MRPAGVHHGIESRVPQALADLIHPQDGGEIQRLISELLHGTRFSFQVECPACVAQDRLLRWTAWVPQKDVRVAEPVFVLAEDVCCVTTACQRLQQAERLETIGRLAGGVAHDFNNLLTGVLLYCDLLMAAIEPAHRARKYAEEIRSAGLQATGLVRQLLSVARSNKSAPRPVSLNEAAEGMQDLLVRLIGENIQLELRLDPALGLVQMQVLSNSARNSAHTACVQCALFAVEDNGQGMNDSVRAHLFEPFFTTKCGKGTGIGLATVHDIVTSNGGLIHVRSELNHGTRISVLLPLIPDSVPVPFDNTSFHPNQNRQVLSSHSEEPTP
jgi:two-component system cell cycle sensor histidine kinase/response regulator CckA